MTWKPIQYIPGLAFLEMMMNQLYSTWKPTTRIHVQFYLFLQGPREKKKGTMQIQQKI